MKKLLSLALCLSLVLACMTGITLTASAATVSGVELAGEGTDAYPYIIDSAAKFKAVFGEGTAADLSKVYLVTGFHSNAMALSNYKPALAEFTGKLLGGNYANNTVTPVKQKLNLSTAPVKAGNYSKRVGLVLHQINNAVVSDFELYGTITVPTMSWDYYFGALAGAITGSNNTTHSVVTRVDNYVNVTGAGNCGYGGIAGHASGYSEITNCNNYGNFSVTGSATQAKWAGGIAGESFRVTISNCNNFGDISGNVYGGGIVGYGNTHPTIRNCANFGTINTTRTDTTATGSGGIAGHMNGSTIDSCYNAGTILNKSYAGSISGITDASKTITVSNCFNYGTVSGNTASGLVLGKNSGNYSISNFYDLTNPDVLSVAGENAGTLTVTNAYGYSETESTTANNVSKVSYEIIKGLTETVDGFKNDAVWNSNSPDYPTLKGTLTYNPVITVDELKNISNYPVENYRLVNDILGMDEMLCTETPFSGVFDGNGKTITIAIDDSANEVYPKFVGLFKHVSGTVKNLSIAGTLNAGYIDWQGGAGSIAGKTSTGSFLIENCKNYATVTSTGHSTAGLIGRAENAGKITKCFNYGDVTAGVKASGIVGVTTTSGSYLTDNGNYGNITGGSYAAGICAWTYTWNWMANSFNVGTITATAKDGKAIGLFGNMTSSQNVNKCFNAGQLVGDITYGIGEINKSNTNTTSIKDCYNAVGADYPIANVHSTWAKLTREYNYYLADASQKDDGTDNTIAVNSKEDLKTLGLTTSSFGIVSGSAYPYMQIKANPIDNAYANIDFSLVTVDNQAENTDVSVWACDDAKFYAVNGKDLQIVANVSDKDFYEAKVNDKAVVDGVAIVTVNGDTTIVITDSVIEAEVPETLAGAVYNFTSDEKGAVTLRDKEYTRYSLIFAKAASIPGLKLKSFGAFFAEDENISKDNFKYQAEGEEGRISSQGGFGILFYTEEGKSGLNNGSTYYVLPYGIYEDVNGEEYVITGATQSFMFNE